MYWKNAAIKACKKRNEKGLKFMAFIQAKMQIKEVCVEALNL